MITATMTRLRDLGIGPAEIRRRKVKWSDRPFDAAKEIRGIIEFANTNKLARMPLVTTYSRGGIKTMNGVDIEFAPTSLHCYTVGRNTLT